MLSNSISSKLWGRVFIQFKSPRVPFYSNNDFENWFESLIDHRLECYCNQVNQLSVHSASRLWCMIHQYISYTTSITWVEQKSHMSIFHSYPLSHPSSIRCSNITTIRTDIDNKKQFEKWTVYFTLIILWGSMQLDNTKVHQSAYVEHADGVHQTCTFLR